METHKIITTKKLQLVLLMIGSILFNWFFWKEDLGLNLLLYTIFIIVVTLLVYPRAKKEKSTLLMIAASLISAFMVFAYGSTVAKLTNLVSLLILIGYAHQPEIKSIFFAGCTTVINFVNFPIKQALKSINTGTTTYNSIISPFKKAKLITVPAIFLFIFYWIFKFANPKFDLITQKFGVKIITVFEWLFSDISWLRIPFFLLGSIIIATCIYHQNIVLFLKKEIGLKDIISRKRKGLIKVSEKGIAMYQAATQTLSMELKNEYRSAIILVGTINLLLLFINYLDISWLWFNFEYEEGFNLAQFVHEGTYLLILSILLSMGIILWFFRENLNFFPNNKLFKQLSVLWIIQNMVLAISVGLRNFYYIREYGLAYKRIGVIVFLLLTLFGLITLILKIEKLKSVFYLIKVNSIAVYSAFLLLSLFNWDFIIAKHNITNFDPQKIDVTFLLTLSENTLPLIDQNRTILDARRGVGYNGEKHHLIFNTKVQEFVEKQEELSWLSTNLSKLRTQAYFKNR